jgi:hypothetical protein
MAKTPWKLFMRQSSSRLELPVYPVSYGSYIFTSCRLSALFVYPDLFLFFNLDDLTVMNNDLYRPEFDLLKVIEDLFNLFNI